MPQQVIDCISACTVTVQHEITTPILNLTMEEGAQISGAILLVWATAFGIRMVLRVLNIDGDSSTKEED